MRFSVLHLSDLHRGAAYALENEPLIKSLRSDAERFAVETPPILPPSICVVTGDLVCGVVSKDNEEELDRQFEQALAFLVSLADSFFGGDRSRLVIVPGNHDISLPEVEGSAEQILIPLEPEEKSRLVAELREWNSQLRWSWRDLCFYRIVDPLQYERRLQRFARLYAAFYCNARSFPLTPAEQYAVFDYPELGVCILALSSCYRNDPWRRIGAFHPVALTRALEAVRAPARTGLLAAAIWHHSIDGGPQQDDYLDMGPLQFLADAGVALCFHGHGHFPEVVDRQLRLGARPHDIKIIGASTLCGGPDTLRPGVPRSYNVVELDTDLWTGRIHQRQMSNLDFELPVWGPGNFASAGSSWVDLELSRPLHERPTYLGSRLELEKAEKLLAQRQWSDAIDVLAELHALPEARPFLVGALRELGNARRTIALLWPPIGTADAVLLGGAILDAGTSAEARAFRNLDLVADSADASVREIDRRIGERWQQ